MTTSKKETKTEQKSVADKKASVISAYVDAIRKYFKFSGRASRFDFWGFTLINSIIAYAIAFVIYYLPGFKYVSIVYALFILIPSITLSYRRLHDVNRSGWWLWLILIFALIFPVMIYILQYIGSYTLYIVFMFLYVLAILGVLITLLYFTMKKGNAEANKYGEPVDEPERFDVIGKRIALSLLALSIILISINIYYAVLFFRSMNNAEINNTYISAGQVSVLADNIKKVHADGNYSGVDTISIKEQGIVPAYMLSENGDGNIVNYFGGKVYVSNNDDSFAVQLTNVPSDSCEEMMGFDWSMQGQTGFQNLILSDEIQSCKECPENGCSMIWIYK